MDDMTSTAARRVPTKRYEAATTLVFVIGISQGVIPLVSKLFFDGQPLLALPARLPGPWWWLVSTAVVVAGLVALEVIDKAKRRAATGDRSAR